MLSADARSACGRLGFNGAAACAYACRGLMTSLAATWRPKMDRRRVPPIDAQRYTPRGTVLAAPPDRRLEVAVRRAPRARRAVPVRALSIAAAIHQTARLDPRHHRTEFLADLFDLVLRGQTAPRLQGRRAGSVFENETLGVFAGLDAIERTLHRRSCFGADDFGARDVFAV